MIEFLQPRDPGGLIGQQSFERPSPESGTRCDATVTIQSGTSDSLKGKAMHDYEVKIRLQGRVSYVHVAARDAGHARMLVEAQYGGEIAVLETKRLR